jgi:cytochrome c551/c552
LGIINQALFENYTCSICHPLNIVMNNN